MVGVSVLSSWPMPVIVYGMSLSVSTCLDLVSNIEDDVAVSVDLVINIEDYIAVSVDHVSNIDDCVAVCRRCQRWVSRKRDGRVLR